MSLSKYFYPRMFTEEQMQEVKRSPVWPMIVALKGYEFTAGLTCSAVDVAGMNPYREHYAYFSAASGACALRVAVQNDSVKIQTPVEPLIWPRGHFNDVIESKNLRYVLRRLGSDNSGSQRIKDSIKDVDSFIRVGMWRLMSKMTEKFKPTETASTFELDYVAQQWAVRMAVGGAQRIAVPKEPLRDIEALMNFYETRDAKFNEYVKTVENYLAGDKYLILHSKIGHSERWYFGGIDLSEHIDAIRKNQSNYIHQNSGITFPFQCFNTIDELDNWIANATGRRVKGTLTMLKLSREHQVPRDADGFIPNVGELTLYPETGTVAWRQGDYSDTHQWFMFDK